MADLRRFGRKLAKAREKRRYKQRRKEEESTIHAVASDRRQEIDFTRKANLASRRTEASTKRATAEENLAKKRAATTAALKHRRIAKRQRLMSERELRREQIRPILEAPKKIITSVRAIPEALRKIQQALPQASSTRGSPQNPFPGVQEYTDELERRMK